MEMEYVVPACRLRSGTNVITRESALQVKTPFMSGWIVNAVSAEARFIGSLNVTTIAGVRFVPAPRGDAVITRGRVTSTMVHVSFCGGGGAPLPAPARGTGRDRYPRAAPPP